MSNVPERLRNLSQFEYYNTAIALRVEVTKLVTSSAVPKSYRFVFATQMAETARSVVFNIVNNHIYHGAAQSISGRASRGS